jgi:hypothetical protein
LKLYFYLTAIYFYLEQIVDKMISKGELKPNILATEIADIDGSGLEAGYSKLKTNKFIY